MQGPATPSAGTPDYATLPAIPSLVATVSSRGIVNGRAQRPNGGAQFGPDTPGTTTCGIQEAIDRAAGPNGPSVVNLVPDGAYEITGCVTFRPRVHVEGFGSVIRNMGHQTAPFSTPEDQVLWKAYIGGLILDCQNAPGSLGLWLNGPQRSVIDVSVFNATDGIRITPALKAKPFQPLFHVNACCNQFRLQMNGIARDALTLEGTGDAACVTDNTFPEVYATMVGRTGIVCSRFVDSNLFGHVFISLCASPSIGVIFNTLADPRQNAGVYDMHFAKLSVDAFGQQNVDAVRLNYTKQILISQLYSSPEGKDFGGTLVRDVAAESYSIYSAGENRVYTKGISGVPPFRGP